MVIQEKNSTETKLRPWQTSMTEFSCENKLFFYKIQQILSEADCS